MNKIILAIAFIIFPALLLGCSGEKTKTAESVVPQTPSPTVQITTQSPTVVEATPSPTVKVPDRILIPHLNLDALLSIGNVGADGMIPVPVDNDTLEVVNFAAINTGLGGFPGNGNTVMLGNLDSGTAPCNKGTVPPPCDAVMKDLHEVSLGDKVMVTWQGKSLEYSVAAICNAPVDKLPAEVYTKTPQERVTLMTAGGDFVEKTQSYTNWLIVIAEKPGSTASCPTGTNSGPPKVTSVTKGGS